MQSSAGVDSKTPITATAMKGTLVMTVIGNLKTSKSEMERVVRRKRSLLGSNQV